MRIMPVNLTVYEIRGIFNKYVYVTNTYLPNSSLVAAHVPLVFSSCRKDLLPDFLRINSHAAASRYTECFEPIRSFDELALPQFFLPRLHKALSGDFVVEENPVEQGIKHFSNHSHLPLQGVSAW